MNSQRVAIRWLVMATFLTSSYGAPAPASVDVEPSKPSTTPEEIADRILDILRREEA